MIAKESVWVDKTTLLSRFKLSAQKGSQKSILQPYLAEKIQWRASSGDGAPKLQISVPCRGRTCPEVKNCSTPSSADPI